MTADMIMEEAVGFIVGSWFGLILAALMDAGR